MSSLPDYADALDRALRAAEPRRHTATVPLSAASSRVLHEAVTSDRDLPPFHRAQMDGYALRAAEFGHVEVWPSAGTVRAGHRFTSNVPGRHCVAIATGATVPDELDTVVPHELTDRGDLHGRPVRLNIDSLAPGQAIHPRGADAQTGQVVIPEGTVLHSAHLAIAAAVGRTMLCVRERAKVIVLTSGDEILPIDQMVDAHQVRNSNAPMLHDLVTRLGGELIAETHVADAREATIDAVGAALQRADLLITVGGVSAGDRDHFPAAFDTFGVDRHLHGAAIQPGRPIFIGRSSGGVVVVGLPGNPVSALACACLFVWPLLRRLTGLEPALPWRRVALTESVRPNARRRAFRPAVLDRDDGARVPKWAGSGDLVHTASTHGLLELPVQNADVSPGTSLRFLPYP